MTSTPHRLVQFLRVAHSSGTFTFMQARGVRIRIGAGLLTGLICAPTHGAQITTEYGYNFVTITDPGNDPIPYELVAPSPINGSQAGRGGVDYTYRIATTEVSSAQWVQFMGTFSHDHAQFVYDNLQPKIWSGYRDFSSPQPGDTWVIAPGFENTIVGGISWRAAAMYVNWLNNGQSSDFDSLMTGAYDASTFVTNPDGSFNDQPAHDPGARFWIPTLDEQLKATHYDPNRFGEGQGGWWLYPYSSDMAPISGWPDEPGAQTSLGVPTRPGMLPEFYIQLGDYPNATTPWGLLDSSGGAAEWTEEVVANPYGDWERNAFGSDVAGGNDRLGYLGFGGPPDAYSARPFTGLRIATAVVPSPPTVLVVLASFACAVSHVRAKR